MPQSFWSFYLIAISFMYLFGMYSPSWVISFFSRITSTHIRFYVQCQVDNPPDLIRFMIAEIMEDIPLIPFRGMFHLCFPFASYRSPHIRKCLFVQVSFFGWQIPIDLHKDVITDKNPGKQNSAGFPQSIIIGFDLLLVICGRETHNSSTTIRA